MVTMSDVAKAAGVSTATVSFALNGNPRITEETAAKVRKVAQELGYTRNFAAGTLRSGRTGVIGLATYELRLAQPSQFAADLSDAAEKRGYQLLTQQVNIDWDQALTKFREVTSQICDGVIFNPAVAPPETIMAISGGNPLLTLDDLQDYPLFDTIRTPSEEGAHAAMTHLLEQGRRRIVILGAKPTPIETARTSLDPGQRRLAGCLRAWREWRSGTSESTACGTTEPMVVFCSWYASQARQTVRRLLRNGVRFDALCCLNDVLAMGAIRALADAGLRVPDDVAVTGFDGIAEGETSTPSLTTVAVDWQATARRAVDMLIDRIQGHVASPASRVETAPWRLAVRESTVGAEAEARPQTDGETPADVTDESIMMFEG